MKYLVAILLTGVAFFANAQNESRLVLQKGHVGNVQRVAFSPDRRFLASGGADEKIIIYDVRTLRTLWEFNNKASVVAMQWSSGSDKLYTNASAGMNTWNVLTGKLESVFQNTEEPIYFFNIQLSPNEKVLAATQMWVMTFYDLRSNRVLKKYSLIKSKDEEDFPSIHLDGIGNEIGDVQFISNNMVAFEAIDKKQRSKAVYLFNWVTGAILSKHSTTIDKKIEEYFDFMRSKIVVSDSTHFAFTDCIKDQNIIWSQDEVILAGIAGRNTRKIRIDTVGSIEALTYNADRSEVVVYITGTKLQVYSAGSGKKRLQVSTMFDDGYQVSEISISNDNRYMACAATQGAVLLFDYKTGARITTLTGELSSPDFMMFSKPGKLVTENENKLVFWDLTNLKNSHTARSEVKTVIGISPVPMQVGDTLYTVGVSFLDLWDLQRERHIRSIRAGGKLNSDAIIGYDIYDRQAALLRIRKEYGTEWKTFYDIAVHDLATDSSVVIASYQKPKDAEAVKQKYWVSFATNFDRSGVSVFHLNWDPADSSSWIERELFSKNRNTYKLNKTTRWRLEGEERKRMLGDLLQVTFGDEFRGTDFITTDSSLITITNYLITSHLYDGRTETLYRIPEEKHAYLRSHAIGNNGQLILGTSRGEIITISGKNISVQAVSKNDVELVAGGYQDLTAFTTIDGWIDLWNKEKTNDTLRILPFTNGQYFMSNRSNYFYASPRGLKNVHFQKGLDIIPLSQLEYRLNQPHRILETIGLSPEPVVNAYRDAYEYRLAKLGITTSAGGEEPAVVVTPRSTSIYNTSGLADFTVKAEDKTARLNNLKILVNNVRVNDSTTSSWLKGKTSAEKTITIRLSGGKNMISFSVINDRGIESQPVSFELIHDASNLPKPKLYLLVLAGSHYADSQYDLKYSVKDGRDIVKLFREQSTYSDIIVDSLFDKNLTLENFRKRSSIIKNLNVDDQVVIYIAGHGLIESSRYYIATYDCDFHAPSSKAIPYEFIEETVNSSASRNKIVFIDACHAGELDPGARPAAVKIDPNDLAASRGGSSGVVAAESGSFNLMNMLFSNLARESGITVLAATSGTTLAYELSEIQNGVFSYSLLEACRRERISTGMFYRLIGSADTNFDSKITVSELQEYMYDRVLELTNGRQQPVDRSINVENDLVLFKLKD
jgi:WD40 repeat protein